MKIMHATQYPSSLRLLLGVVIATFVFTAAANAQPSSRNELYARFLDS